MVEVREARYFIAVAEELNFGRAATRLHMSQPPLSAAIKALECRLGAVLLHRTTREVRLTSVGTVFLDHCRSLVAASNAADSAARQAADGQAGELQIGAVTTAFAELTGALKAYRAYHRRVDVRLREVDTHVGVELVRRGELDIAVVRRMSTPRGCERVVLRRESFVLAAPADWSLPRGLDRDLSRGAELPWVWIPRGITPDYHDQVASCCRAAGFTPVAQHLAQSLTSQLVMVAAGLGVALVPASTVSGYVSGGSVKTVEVKNSAEIELAALWRRAENRLIADFLDEMTSAR